MPDDSAPVPVYLTFPEFSVHLLGATPAGQWLEYLDYASPILEELVHIEGGYAMPSDRPRSGLAWNEEAVQKLITGPL